MKEGSIKIKTAPTVEPLTAAEAKAHLRVGTSDEDAYITSLIKVARIAAESFQNRSYLETTLEYYCDQIPVAGEKIKLPIGSVISVTSVQIVQRGTTAAEIPATAYDVNTAAGNIAFNDTYSPEYDSSLVPATGCLIITYKAGYGTTAAAVPETAKQAMLLIIGHLFEHREAATDGYEVKTVPMAAQWLLRQGRLY